MLVKQFMFGLLYDKPMLLVTIAFTHVQNYARQYFSSRMENEIMVYGVGLKCPYIQHGTSSEIVYAYSDYINAPVLNSY
jgi:hypothetical protein